VNQWLGGLGEKIAPKTWVVKGLAGISGQTLRNRPSPTALFLRRLEWMAEA
jgi:hypothetical protein